MYIAAALLTHWDHDEMTNIFSDIFKVIFICENCYILIQISLKLVLSCPFHNSSAILYIMVWHWTGDKPLSKSIRSGWLQSNLGYLFGEKYTKIFYFFPSHNVQLLYSRVQMNQNYPFLKLRYVKSWTWKFKVKVRGGVKCQGDIVSPTSYWFMSLFFHVNQTTHSWNIAISKFDLENPRSRSWVESKVKVIWWIPHCLNSCPFCSMSNKPSNPEIWSDIQRRPVHDVQSHDI